MKKIMIAAMSLSLLTGTVVFAQDTMGTSTDKKMKSKMKHKTKKTTSTDTMSAPK